jgi:hypothetical protein
MQQHVGIAVADQVVIVRHVDATDAQRAARLGAMRILTQSNPQILARGGFSVTCVMCRECPYRSRGIIPKCKWSYNASCTANTRGRGTGQVRSRRPGRGIPWRKVAHPRFAGR